MIKPLLKNMTLNVFFILLKLQTNSLTISLGIQQNIYKQIFWNFYHIVHVDYRLKKKGIGVSKYPQFVTKIHIYVNTL